MSRRAEAAADTWDRIVDALLARFASLPYDRIRLEDVATDAGVSLQTVLRRFGSKAGLVTAMAERELSRIAETREHHRGEPPASVVADLVTHYERYGDLILKVYAESARSTGWPRSRGPDVRTTCGGARRRSRRPWTSSATNRCDVGAAPSWWPSPPAPARTRWPRCSPGSASPPPSPGPRPRRGLASSPGRRGRGSARRSGARRAALAQNRVIGSIRSARINTMPEIRMIPPTAYATGSIFAVST